MQYRKVESTTKHRETLSDPNTAAHDYFNAFFIFYNRRQKVSSECRIKLGTGREWTNLLHVIQIIRLYSYNLLAEQLFDLFHLQPCLLIVHEIDRDPLAPKSSSSTC